MASVLPRIYEANADSVPGACAKTPPPRADESPLGKIHNTSAYFPLALDGWLEYNAVTWGVRPLRTTYTLPGKDLPAIDTVIYLNRRGHLVLPPLNPYFPQRLITTPTESETRLTRQWLDLGAQVANDWRKRGLDGTLMLDPVITDARPFQWAGFREGLRYTLQLKLHLELDKTEHDARKNILKALRRDYTWCLADSAQDVVECLASSEERKHFSHMLSANHLGRLAQLLGPEHVSFCACYTASGEPASARVVLHAPGTCALDWIGGTKTQHLQTGATPLSILFAMQHVYEHGSTSYDFAGANIANVANSKMKWRGHLVPYITLQQHGVRSLARFMLDWRWAWQLRRQGK